MIMGIAWMSDTVISGNKGYITDLLKAEKANMASAKVHG